jgi:hypothetical protein
MVDTISFKRLILRAVLRQVSPMVIRLISVSDQMRVPEFHDVFRAILGWNGDLGYIIRVHGQEFNSFRRKMRSKALHEFKLHRQEKFLYVCDYVCDTLHMWEWDVRVLDIQVVLLQHVLHVVRDLVDLEREKQRLCLEIASLQNPIFKSVFPSDFHAVARTF